MNMKDEPLIKVAYADDHTAVRKSISSYISMLGNIEVCIQASSGNELIERLSSAEVFPDVCMLDINMPDMDGFDTLEALKSRWPEMRTLVLTVYDIELYIIRMIVSGANGYLLKGCDPDEICKAIYSIHTNGIYHSDKKITQFYQAVRNDLVVLPNFTPRELQVLKYCCTDLSYAEIAKAIKTTTRSVTGQRDSLFKKLNVNTRVALALYAIKFGLVQIEPELMTKNFFHKKIKAR